MSQLISIGLARPGMRLAEEVPDAAGKPLAARGETLGEALLTLFRERGVRELKVETGVAPVPQAGSRERLEYLFRRTGHDATTQALLRVMIEYREERPK